MSGAPDPYADFASPTASGGDPYAAIAAPVAAAGPRSDYGGDRVSDKSLGDLVAESMGVQPGSEAYLKRKAYGHRADRWIDAGIRGATDAATFGYADELAAGLESIPAIFSDHETLGQAYKRHVADERAIDQADQEDLPVTRGAGELGGVGVTMAGSLIAAPGRLVSRGLMQNALRGAGEGAAYGGLSSSGHAEGNPLERGKAAIPGALAGAALGGVLAPVADAAGGAINALRTRGGSELDRAANALRSRVDVPAARLRANALTDAGAEPTAVSAMDESGRGFVRAAASRMTPGREVVQQRAEAASLNLPDRIARQAEGHISADPAAAGRADAVAGTRIDAATTPPGAVNNDAGARIHAHLNRQYDAAKAGVDEAYNAARAGDPQAAHIPSAELPHVAANIRDAVRDFHPDDIPSVTRELGSLDQTSTPTVRDLFELRQRLTGIRLAKPEQGVAAGRAISALDHSINDLADRGAITGDPEVVGLWRTAISSRRQLARDFEGDDLIAQLTERGTHGAGRTTTVAPEDASNVLLGRGGVSNRADTARDLTRLRDRLGAESPEWQALQAEAVSRVLRRDAGREDYGRAWDAFAQANPELAGVLMGPAQRAALDAARSNVGAALANRNAVHVGGSFMQPGSADTFATAVNALPPEQAALARSAAARTVQQRAGENVSAAPGVARKLAFAPEQRARNRALLGDEGAQQFESGMAAEARTTRDLNDVAPRTGSQTQLRAADQAAVSKVASAVHTIMGGAPAWGVALLGRLKTAGLNDADAEAVAKVATDPAQLQDLLARMERMKPGSGDALLSVLHVGVAESAGGVAQPAPAIELNISRSTNPEFLAAQAKRGLIWDEQAGHFVKKAP